MCEHILSVQLHNVSIYLPVLQVKREELMVGQYIPVASNPPICSLSFVQGKKYPSSQLLKNTADTRTTCPQHVLDKHMYFAQSSQLGYSQAGQ